jgi:hypothetical protein
MKPKALSVFIVAVMFTAPISTSADMLDVIRSSLKDGCSMEKYLAIIDDFNAYYKDRGYQTEILQPLHSELGSGVVIWVGRATSFEAFGKAYDHWEAELDRPGSTVSKLSARFGECTTTLSRASYMTAR